jgi:hypothetical protein
VVSAVPGSPFRQWISSGWDRVSGSGPLTVEEEAPGSAETGLRAEGGETGAGIEVAAGEVELRIHDCPEGAEVRVVLVEGDVAAIYGPEGTHFRTEAGRIEAIAPPGGVRVEVPRRAERVSVFVNGEAYFLKSGDRLEILGPVRDSAATEIRFLSGGPAPPNGRPR